MGSGGQLTPVPRECIYGADCWMNEGLCRKHGNRRKLSCEVGLVEVVADYL